MSDKKQETRFALFQLLVPYDDEDDFRAIIEFTKFLNSRKMRYSVNFDSQAVGGAAFLGYQLNGQNGTNGKVPNGHRHEQKHHPTVVERVIVTREIENQSEQDAERNNSVCDHNLPEEDEDSSILKPKKEDMNDSVLMWNPMKAANSRNTTANFGESSFAEPPADNSCSVFGKLNTEDKRLGNNDFKQPRNGFNGQPHSTFNTKFGSGSAFGNSSFQKGPTSFSNTSSFGSNTNQYKQGGSSFGKGFMKTNGYHHHPN
ncbi:hypothetical protein WR25_06586 [Diploscapter pachys]|uniref:Uncharacterized protein n=1 Tax=Diploscapter pachys TaxID=2018661 RepID=A0A2A2L0T1_9BILA|nr:hypothetical protein WR25_06586 [Diploscapter pachys]